MAAMQALATFISCTLPGVIISTQGRPFKSQMASLLEFRPPRVRPMLSAKVPLLRRLLCGNAPLQYKFQRLELELPGSTSVAASSPSGSKTPYLDAHEPVVQHDDLSNGADLVNQAIEIKIDGNEVVMERFFGRL
jgi:hypothetical protein